jgi:plastocyanin
MRLLLAALLASLGLISQALAQDFSLTIKDHRFEPVELQVPAGKAFTLNVTNSDATAEEFESDDLDVEKVIAGGQSAVVKIEPLDAGRYEFYGEYHEATAKGALVAK